ncbi:uncharacterized protein LOC110757549 isoform X1 [Prunus avium]|uniref:Uncharacterized protein LOC110757549 isoform X1 n=1 Tax=Prunus avium TaxID=42229 RepID=A0A6P5SL06_PRUAV|nr:uncharacterized protein LOC110757549 isoform X1 [Prunus avium]
MDLVLSLDCQKSDAQSVGLNEDRGAKELFAPDIPRISDLSICVNSVVVNKKGGGKVFCPPEMVPLHHDTSLLLKLGWPIGSKAEETKAGPDGTYIPSFQLPRPDIGECEYCLKVGEHIPQRCPYKDHVPKNAILGSGCDVVCRVCGWFFRGSCCRQDEGRAILKNCGICLTTGKHWSASCPTLPPASRKDIPSEPCFSIKFV